jgi:hypothetical protein
MFGCRVLPAHALRVHALLLTGVAALLSSHANAAAASEAGIAAASAVRDRIGANDCAGAVSALKDGVKKGYPEVSLLAGTMYDLGACVKPDWERAVLFYAQACQDGMEEAADRMAAGFADPARGPDIAAALWWAGRGKKGFAPQSVSYCAVGEAAVNDVDRFVAELKTWDTQRLAVCNYIAGVMSMMSAEMKYPELARAHGIGGLVELRFLPSVPKFAFKRGDMHEYRLLGVVSGDTLRRRDSPPVTGAFEKALGEVADRALRRYPHPGGIPADALIRVQFRFDLE